MTSSNRNIFRVTGPLCGEFTGPGEFPTQRPVTRSFDVFFDPSLNKRFSKRPWGWWFETPSWSLWRRCNQTYGQTTIWWAYLSVLIIKSPGKCGSNCKSVIFEAISQNCSMEIFAKIGIRRIPHHLINDKSTLVQEMSRYRQVTSLCMRQYHLRSISSCGVTRKRRVNRTISRDRVKDRSHTLFVWHFTFGISAGKVHVKYENKNCLQHFSRYLTRSRFFSVQIGFYQHFEALFANIV